MSKFVKFWQQDIDTEVQKMQSSMFENIFFFLIWFQEVMRKPLVIYITENDSYNYVTVKIKLQN